MTEPQEARAELASTEEAGEGLYTARLLISYRGRRYTVEARRLIRRPAAASARQQGDYLLIELYDDQGKPVATCCIHRGHLEKGCLDCPSLLNPPRESQ
ncbi:hypothetical protein CF15_01025 [Pyrodictium occultum]|uniref:Uncharacterized protein n=1 Tax=Pyrodictium occultum TaxID=2309 RepID=A0A0V8RTR4_PYROC|nr:hypothetical protein [Pyrodictium occultum]KSW11467.1 hypothetical protein CF15_01025 [Pyrodictium occultum]